MTAPLRGEMRAAQSQANKTFGTATDNAAGFGADASTVGANLVPALLQKMNAPQGYSQTDLGAMIANALGSAGGATSAIAGTANREAGRTRNDAGFASSLAEAARARTSAVANASSGIAADNANLKVQQQTDAQKMLAGLYGTNVNAQNDSLRTADEATRTGIEAGQTGWLQQVQGLLGTVGNLAGGAGTLATGLKGRRTS